MATIEFSVERLLPCACLALSDAPFTACPECGGAGECWQEVEVVIEYSYHRARRGARDRYGAPIEPDDDGGPEIESITDENGRDVTLTWREERDAEARCARDAEDRARDAAEARYERMIDARY